MDAFDADVLIYAAVPDHELGRRVRLLFTSTPPDDTGLITGVGSVLLLPELLTKPMRDGLDGEVEALAAILGRLELLPVDLAMARLATSLASRHGLRAADAVHLATAVAAGASRFVTNNSSDFPRSITEIEIVYPIDLPDPGAA